MARNAERIAQARDCRTGSSEIAIDAEDLADLRDCRTGSSETEERERNRREAA